MNSDFRGSISREGSINYIKNGLVEKVFLNSGSNGYITISYAVPQPDGTNFPDLLRLNINNGTVIKNASGIPICLCDVQPGMWIDSIFSPMTTRSIPPQSSAYVIIAKEGPQTVLNTTTDYIAFIDLENNLVYIGDPEDMSKQLRLSISPYTSILDYNGRPVFLHQLFLVKESKYCMLPL